MANNEKWQKKVWFSVRPLLNLNRTALNLNRWSGSKFGTLLEPNLKSGSRFGKIFGEPDRTELRHPYFGDMPLASTSGSNDHPDPNSPQHEETHMFVVYVSRRRSLPEYGVGSK
jgi:hypothetical protein